MTPTPRLSGCLCAHITIACTDGLMYTPTTSTTRSTKGGLVKSRKTPKPGLMSQSFQISCTPR